MDLLSLPEYLAHETLFAPCDLAVLRMKGDDARAFMQRMSTNDMAKLSPNNPTISCFLSNKGRLIDRVLIFETAPDDFLLVSSFHDPGHLLQWIENYHFAEDFSIEPCSAWFPKWAIATSALEHPLSASMGELRAPLKAQLFLLLSHDDLATRLSPADWQMIRIAAGLPLAPYEINDQFMPQNVGLLATISDTKGCYIGQEVIAKALTYQKNTKSLQRFRLAAEDINKAAIGLKVQSEDHKRALITSLAPSFIAGWPHGLAVVENRESVSDAATENLLKAQFIF